MKKKIPSDVWSASERSMKKIVGKVGITIPEFDNKEHYIPSFGVEDPDKELRKDMLARTKRSCAKEKAQAIQEGT